MDGSRKNKAFFEFMAARAKKLDYPPNAGDLKGMKENHLARTEYIVLRKTPHKESSLIVAGVSPRFGRLDFVVRGARKEISKTKLPFVDLFRELSVEFDPRLEGLRTLRFAELSREFDNIANHPRNYEAACLLGAFLLRVSQGHPSAP